MHRTYKSFAAALALGALWAATACLSMASPREPFMIAWSYDTNGYLETCGCSAHQLGGLGRRATLLKQLRAKQPVLAIEGAHMIADAGEFHFFKGETIVSALNLMDYHALQLGIREAQHGAAGLRKLSEQAKFPCFCANLVVNREPWEIPYTVVPIAGARVAITGVSQPEAASFELPAGIEFSDPRAALDAVLKKMRPKAGLLVVCLEGEQTWVEQLASDYAGQADLFLAGSRGDTKANLGYQSDPPLLNTWDEGRYLGIVAVNPAEKQLTLAGSNLPLEEKYADDPQIADLLENTYRPQLKERFFGALKVNFKELYLPAEVCLDCHKEAVEAYNNSGHAHALQTLVDKNQQYNPDCMSCHVVYDPDTDELQPMNCSVCHYNITEQHLWDAANELPCPKPDPPVATHTYKFCAHCHDPINSANFAAHWPQYVNKIYHGGDLKAAQRAAKELGVDMKDPPPAHE